MEIGNLSPKYNCIPLSGSFQSGFPVAPVAVSEPPVNLKITPKLFFALSVTILVVVTVMLLMIRFSFHRGFLDYVNRSEFRQIDQVAEQLKEGYRLHGNWSFLKDNEQAWREFTRSPGYSRSYRADNEPRSNNTHHHGKWRGRNRLLDIGPRLGLADPEQNHIAGLPDIPVDSISHIISLDDTPVGILYLAPLRRFEKQLELKFVKRQNRSFYLIALLSLVVAGIGSVLLARQFLSPIKEMTQATRRLADGDLDVHLPTRRKDELGELARDFNRLADILARNEHLRRQWVTDIAHELRTPLTTLRGEIEALQDGVRQWSDETGNSLHAEALRLSTMVNDLYELSKADEDQLHYDLQTIDIIPCLTDTLELFQGRFDEKKIRTTFAHGPDPSYLVEADWNRMVQLFTNVLENSLRYTDRGGQLEVRTTLDKDWIVIEFNDSAPGAPDDALPKIFDRLFRVDPSRSRASGGAGIGLSICQKIVQGHHGRISAAHSPLGGLTIAIRLPGISSIRMKA